MQKKDKPKLLYIITKSNWGGAQKYVYDLATSDIKNRFEISVLAGDEGELIEKLREAGTKVHTLLTLKRNINIIKDLQSLRDMYSLIKEISPDIVHLNSSKAGLLGAAVSRILKIKSIIFTAHGWPFNENRSLVSKLFFRALMQLTVYLSHRTIAVSSSTIKTLKPLPAVKKKMQIIYNGLREVSIKDLPKLSSGSSVKHLVSIGELHPVKNHISVIRMLRHVKGVHYHIIGTGELEGSLKKEITKLGLESRVTLHGHVKMAVHMLPQFDIYIHPSTSEALPYAPIEALMAGLPVIGRDAGGIPEVLATSSQTVLYSHDSELINILTTFNPKTKKDHHDKFKFESMINETKNLYLTMLN